MTIPSQLLHLGLAVYLSISIKGGVAAMINGVTDYEELDYAPAQDNPIKTYLKRDDIDKMISPFRMGRQLYARELQDLVLSLPKNSRYYDLIGEPINTAPSENRESRYVLKNAVSKRQRISVPRLAQLLNSMKTRNVEEDGVKLQTLRFGK